MDDFLAVVAIFISCISGYLVFDLFYTGFSWAVLFGAIFGFFIVHGIWPKRPNVSSADKVILFDGVCKLCNAWSNFIIKHYHQHVFKLCSVQSDEGQEMLSHFGLFLNLYAIGCMIVLR
jgi:hypothetical protein